MSEHISSQDISPKKGFSVRYGDSKRKKVDREEQERAADALKKIFAEEREEDLKEIESRIHRKKTP